jgi:hypothetical protein
MGLHEHFHDRDEMKEEGHAAQMYAPPARTLGGIEHSGENCAACREVKNGRDSEP